MLIFAMAKERCGQILPPYKPNHVVDANGCWIWQGYVMPNGYGTKACRKNDGSGSRTVMTAHRYYYIHFKGEVPLECHIDHLCRVTRCVNPDHLEAVSPSENSKRSSSDRGRRRTLGSTCKNGHIIDGFNAMEKKRINAFGEETAGLACRQCHNENQMRRYYRKNNGPPR